jgi:hypothetical protein
MTEYSKRVLFTMGGKGGVGKPGVKNPEHSQAHGKTKTKNPSEAVTKMIARR